MSKNQKNKNVEKFNLLQSFRVDTKAELGEGEVMVKFSTDDKVVRFNWETYDLMILEFSQDPESISLERLNSGAPAQLDHGLDFDSNVGVVLSADSEYAHIKFDLGSEKGKEAYRKVKEGFITSVSMGTEIISKEPAGRFKKGDEEYDMFKVTKHEPYEISFVTVPALKNAKVINFSEFEKISVDTKDSCKQKLENKGKKEMSGAKPETLEMSETQKEELRKEAIKHENLRQEKIRRFATGLKFDIQDEFVQKFLKNTDITADEACEQFFKKAEELEAKKEALKPNHSNESFSASSIETNLAEDSKKESLEKVLKDRFDQKIGDTFKNEHTLVLLANYMSLTKGQTFGVDVKRPMEFVNLAHNIGDFPKLLTESSTRRLLDEKVKTRYTYNRVGYQETSNDLKAIELIDVSGIGKLQDVNENSEFEKGTMKETGKTITVSGKGLEIDISERALINDDLNAFSRVQVMLARSIQNTRNNAFYNVLKNHSFAVNRKSTYGADEAGLKAMSTAFQKYTRTLANKDAEAEFLNNMIELIVAPPDLRYAIAEVLKGQIVATKSGDVNGIQLLDGNIDLVTDPELTDANDYYGMESPNNGNPGLIYRTYSGLPDGEIVSRVDMAKRCITLQAFDYFAAFINNEDAMIKAENA